MISATTIRQDLKEIRHYFSHRDLFDEVSSEIGTNSIMEKGVRIATTPVTKDEKL